MILEVIWRSICTMAQTVQIGYNVAFNLGKSFWCTAGKVVVVEQENDDPEGRRHSK